MRSGSKAKAVFLAVFFLSRQTLTQFRLALEPSVSEDDLELIILPPPLSRCWVMDLLHYTQFFWYRGLNPGSHEC